MNKYELILLDAGGIIVDESEIEKYYAETIAGLLNRDDPEYTIDNYWQDVGVAVNLYCESVYRSVVWANCKPDLDKYNSIFDNIISDVKSNRPDLKLSEFIAEEITNLGKNYKIGIAGQYDKELLELLDKHNILDKIDFPLVSSDFPITKPDPRFYEMSINRIGLNPRKTVMVGDRIDKDVIPSRRVGMKSVRIMTGIHRNQEPRNPDEFPDLELDTLEGLAENIMRKFPAE